MTALTAGDLTILDDIFPHQYSGFRYAEYRAYLQHFDQSVVYSTGESIPLIDENRELDDVVREFESDNPNLSNRVFRYSKNVRRQKDSILSFCRIFKHLLTPLTMQRYHLFLRYIQAVGFVFTTNLAIGFCDSVLPILSFAKL